jgi:predicted metal-binding protein
MPSLRRDIICLCCGNAYRPDDIMDAVNMFLCLTCKKEGEEIREVEPFNYGTQQP